MPHIDFVRLALRPVPVPRAAPASLATPWPWFAGLAFLVAVSAGCATSSGPASSGGSAGSSGSGASSGIPGGYNLGGTEAGALSNSAPDATLGDTLADGAVVSSDGALIESVSIAPANPTLVVTITDDASGNVTVDAPTQSFTATSGGANVNVGWSVDRGEIGSISPSGLFTPSGTTAGTAHVIAGFGTMQMSTTVTVVIKRTQNGFTGAVNSTSSGGYGGVGGSGPGGPVSSDQMTALQGTPAADPARTFLYPYDKTVWPRGLLAPLLQWTQGANDATAVALHLQSANYTYDGYFGRPAALGTGAFVNHPIPQDVWQQATESTDASDSLGVSVVFLAGGAAVGPIEESWIVASGILQGTVYYQSYGTQLVQNTDQPAQDGSYFGAAILAIKPGETAPRLAAGTNSAPGAKLGSGAGCRACHSVAAQGGSLITQDNAYPYAQTSLYSLQTGNETQVFGTVPATAAPPYPLSWAALSPDGTYALTNAVWMGSSTDDKTELYQIGAGGMPTPVAAAGLGADLVGATPVFSPDGAHAAFTHVSGTLGALTGDGTHVVAVDFAGGAGGASFSNPKNVFTLATPGTSCVGFPSFLPTNDALLVQLQLVGCGDGNQNSNTSYGQYVGTARYTYSPSAPLPAEIWWTDVATGTQHRMDALDGYNPDGTSYLPTGPNNHGMDSTLNYEPTVNPAPSGGYAWVIFTSRRLYGNVATIDPSSSDPRDFDYAHEVTTKKLWVAAIDLNAPPGTDPSHPAFYLPAQELQAGNARGFWVLDPCAPDGTSCQSGDQCCGGYCQAGGDGGLVCADMTATCSQYGDKCGGSSKCCDPAALCINSICSPATPPPPPPR
ncbi:MAG TPA: hypothetical protein VK841_26395 [Polyangiaceae bacterium]|nr:hypothetical protein [Polyangiaceae bacterium]